MRSLAEANAILEAQRAELSSDDELRREASYWREASPAECVAAVFELCREGDHFLSLLTTEQLAVALTPDPLPADSIALLESMRRTPR